MCLWEICVGTHVHGMTVEVREQLWEVALRSHTGISGLMSLAWIHYANLLSFFFIFLFNN